MLILVGLANWQLCIVFVHKLNLLYNTILKHETSINNQTRNLFSLSLIQVWVSSPSLQALQGNQCGRTWLWFTHYIQKLNPSKIQSPGVQKAILNSTSLSSLCLGNNKRMAQTGCLQTNHQQLEKLGHFHLRTWNCLETIKLEYDFIIQC